MDQVDVGLLYARKL